MKHPSLHKTLHELFAAPIKHGELGIELEIEGENLPTGELTGWNIKSELSLRGKNGRTVSADENAFDTPREYVLRSPVSYTRMITRLDTLVKALKQPGVVVRLTPRASTHIHLNVAEETVETLMGFLLVYLTAEPLLLRLCGDHRNGNLFCLPGYETGDMGSFVRGVITQLNKHGFGGHHQWWTRGKYAALNTDPVSSLGSVEIRCFPNTVDDTEILKWCQWVLAMKKLAKSEAAPFSGLMDRMYNDPAWFIVSVFGSIPTHSLSQHPHDLVRFGFENAYETWRKMDPLFNYVEVTDKDKPAKKNFKKLMFDPGNSVLSYDDLPQTALWPDEQF